MEFQDRRLLPLTLINQNPKIMLNSYHIFDGGSKIIDLSKLNIELKKLIVLILLHYLYNNPQHNILLVIEEAQNVLLPRRAEDPPSIGEMIVAELRRHNIGVIMIAHHSDDLPRSILNDAYTIVSLSKKSMPFRIEDPKLQKKSKLLFYENGSKVKPLTLR